VVKSIRVSAFALACLHLSVAQSALAQQEQLLPQQTLIGVDGAQLDVDIWGTGDEIVIALPGLGSDTSRFALLAPKMASAGFKFVTLNPRQIRRSTGSLEDLTLDVLATDVSNLAKAMNAEKVHLLGWAFGNRVARTTASLHPNVVATVTLLAAGGKVPPSAETAEIMTTLFTSNNMPADQRAEFVQAAFYSPASDGAALERQFRGGTWRDARLAQLTAARGAPLSTWWSGGAAPLLVIQGLDDKSALPENGRLMKREFPDRVQLVELADTGHMLPIEQPDQVVKHIVAFLREHRISN
jgi:pimeloyl-ACP methyl ester carboxylesterase